MGILKVFDDKAGSWPAEGRPNHKVPIFCGAYMLPQNFRIAYKSETQSSRRGTVYDASKFFESIPK